MYNIDLPEKEIIVHELIKVDRDMLEEIVKFMEPESILQQALNEADKYQGQVNFYSVDDSLQIMIEKVPILHKTDLDFLQKRLIQNSQKREALIAEDKEIAKLISEIKKNCKHQHQIQWKDLFGEFKIACEDCHQILN